MDARILLFIAVAATAGFNSVIAKPIQKIPVEPGVQPATESQLVVSTQIFPPRWIIELFHAFSSSFSVEFS